MLPMQHYPEQPPGRIVIAQYSPPYPLVHDQIGREEYPWSNLEDKASHSTEISTLASRPSSLGLFVLGSVGSFVTGSSTRIRAH